MSASSYTYISYTHSSSRMNGEGAHNCPMLQVQSCMVYLAPTVPCTFGYPHHAAARARVFRKVAQGYLGTLFCLQVLAPQPTRRRSPPHIPGYGRRHASAILSFAEWSPPYASSALEQWQEKLASRPNRKWVAALLTRGVLWVPHWPSGTGTLSGHTPEHPISPHTGASGLQLSYPAAIKQSHHRPTAPTVLPRDQYEQYSGYIQRTPRQWSPTGASINDNLRHEAVSARRARTICLPVKTTLVYCIKESLCTVPKDYGNLLTGPYAALASLDSCGTESSCYRMGPGLTHPFTSVYPTWPSKD